MENVAAFFRDLGLSFIPLFVALDPIGVLSFVLAMTRDMTPRQRPRTIRFALLTAAAMGLAFVGIGKGIFIALGIKVADFLVAGGLILLILAIKDLITGKMMEAEAGEETVGVVPLGTPLIAGPAVLTTLLVLIDLYSLAVVITAFVANLLIAWLAFAQANRVAGFLGNKGLQAASKIVSLLLAAIAVRMIRLGILEIMSS